MWVFGALLVLENRQSEIILYILLRRQPVQFRKKIKQIHLLRCLSESLMANFHTVLH